MGKTKKRNKRRKLKKIAKKPLLYDKILPDGQIVALSQLSCHVFVFRALEEFSLLLENLTLELVGEEGPFIPAVSLHFQTAKNIIDSIQELYNAKLKFRNCLRASNHADQHLEQLPKFLTQARRHILEKLNIGNITEQDAAKIVKDVAKYARQLSIRISNVQLNAKKKIGECSEQFGSKSAPVD